MNPLIIKLGGVLLDSEEALERLFTALVNYRESHQRPLGRPVDIASWRHAEQLPALFNGTPIGTRILA